ncbi:GntR family transcriptional regulator [Acuticoccus sp. MNP-M23]|uniref:GntR family transcriptional regulator n=1 Tax=Acuticoccus sp. MNP-M23 TaxID=3072793 RepID=UPI002814BB1D|nr:GntR family transcriptional regulator [Acuticoccus sp. MNP-M23]WMS42822.1 GntR family transcriptional regulator [Acuticoccus sp. MNP-M23]
MTTAQNRPIRRRTLHEEVVTRLRDMIIDGTLETGSRVNESELGPVLGVSRTPLREALRTLASEGLIELVPAKGAVVRRFGVEEVAGMLEALKALEGFCARVGVGRCTDAEIDAVLALHADMVVRYEARERLAYYKLNQSIHSAIVALSQNASLCEMHGLLQGRLKRIRYLGNHGPDKWAEAMAEHVEMAEALARRDGEALAKVLELHMENTLERVRAVL